MPTNLSKPAALIAELTHRPLHCVCLKPLEVTVTPTKRTPYRNLDPRFKEAAAGGALQADFTAGEPLARPDT